LKTCATTTTKMKVAKVRAETKTIGIADHKRMHYATMSLDLSDKLSVLFEPHHARRIHSHYPNINLRFCL